MGRFTSVQAYTDSNANARTIPYEQAVGRSTAAAATAAAAIGAASVAAADQGVASASTAGPGRVLAVKPEKVVNPYGSAAGAGSGDFHVYRHARARELERVAQLEQSAKERDQDLQFQEQLQRAQQHEAERTAQRRKKRLRQRQAKQRKENLRRGGVRLDERDGEGNGDDDAEEFTYHPERDVIPDGGIDASSAVDATCQEASSKSESSPLQSVRPSAVDAPTTGGKFGASGGERKKGHNGRTDGGALDNDSDSDDDSVGPQPEGAASPLPPAKKPRLPE